MTEVERLWTQVELHLPPEIPDAHLNLIKTAWHDGARAMLDAASALTKRGDMEQALRAMELEGEYLNKVIVQLREARERKP